MNLTQQKRERVEEVARVLQAFKERYADSGYSTTLEQGHLQEYLQYLAEAILELDGRN